MVLRPPIFTLFPYTTLFRSLVDDSGAAEGLRPGELAVRGAAREAQRVLERACHHDRTVAERSEEHTSELQSLRHLVCRLLLEIKDHQCGRQLVHDSDVGLRA